MHSVKAPLDTRRCCLNCSMQNHMGQRRQLHCIFISWFHFEISSNQAHKLHFKMGREESGSKKAGLCHKRRSRRTQKILWLRNQSRQLVGSWNPALHFDGRRRAQPWEQKQNQGSARNNSAKVQLKEPTQLYQSTGAATGIGHLCKMDKKILAVEARAFQPI